MLDQLAWSLMTLEQPEHTETTAASDGCAVTTAGMPVMTPSELVMVV